MSFTSLGISLHTPDRVKEFIERQIKMQFEDIHTMLRLPIESQDLLAGCNFSTANSLLALVSGLSALELKNLDTTGRSGKMFKNILEVYYPWDIQVIEGDTTPHGTKGAVDHLYKYFRNPLAHSLGVKHQGNFLVAVDKGPLSESAIEILENMKHSPGPAIIYSPIAINNENIEKITLNIPNFYWGVRTMLSRMTENRAFMEKVEVNLASIGL